MSILSYNGGAIIAMEGKDQYAKSFEDPDEIQK